MSSPVPGADQRALAEMANELAIQKRELELLKMGQLTSALGFSSIENGSLVIYDADGNPRNVIGQQDDGSYVGGAAPVALDPPEVPKPPKVTPGFGILKVESQGSTDPPWPKSFSHLNVYLSSGTGSSPGDPITPGVVVGTIIGYQDSAFVIAGLEAGKTYRVWLTSVGIDTAESDASTAVTAIPTQVVAQDILDNAITELQLADDAVTQAKIAAGAVGTIQIEGESIDVTKLADGSVDGQKIVANAIGVGHLAAASVTSIALAAGAVQAENIAVGAIQAGHLAVGSITAESILALSIQSDHLAANAVTAGKIDVGAVRASHLQAGIIIADATMETGTSGRRVVISGPGNEIRFFPQLNEFAYGRLFSYVSDLYPEDVNIELRAIDSDEVNVQPRFVLTPDTIVGAITDRGDETVNRGGRFQLEESVAAIGVKNPNGNVDVGAYFYENGGIKFHGYWANYDVVPDDAAWVMAEDFTNGNASGGNYYTGLDFYFNYTRTKPYIPIMSAGMKDHTDSTEPRWTVREGTPPAPTVLNVEIGNYAESANTAYEIHGVKPGRTVGVRIFCLTVDQIIPWT